MNKITFCIPSKDNLRYLKMAINSILTNSELDNEILVWLDSDNDNTSSWLDSMNIQYLVNSSPEPRGIAVGYNECIKAATTDIVCMFHADMYMAKGFDVNLVKHLKPKHVVAATRIEPPLHPAGKEKIIGDYGMYPEDFKKQQFDDFVEQTKLEYLDRTTSGIFAPWGCYKSDLMDINLHDEMFHSYHEDSDIFNRMILNNIKCIQSWDSLVYHFTCRGGQFQDGIEQVTTNPKFHQMKSNAQRNYIRKWGSWIKNDEFQHPIITPLYQIGIQIKNCTSAILELLEPYCTRIYIEDGMQVLTSHYIDSEQSKTKFDLSKRIMTTEYNNPHEYDDIVVEIDAKRMTNDDAAYIFMLPEIIQSSGEIGEFRLGNLKITIHHIETYEKNLIKVD
jgi:glycosyltransferase involved in cell wall biosynthesis